MSPCSGLFFYAKRKQNKQTSCKKKVKPSRQTDWLDYQVKVVKIDKLELVKVYQILVYQWRLHSTLFTMVFRFFLFNCAATPEGLRGWVRLLIRNLIPLIQPKRLLAWERSCQYPNNFGVCQSRRMLFATLQRSNVQNKALIQFASIQRGVDRGY